MAIPDYQTIMLPVLNFASDKQEHPLREAMDVPDSQLVLMGRPELTAGR